jgi:phosphoribosyl-AMP cyclohydrolase
VQKLHEMRLDCDADVIILMVEQIGGIACHTGRKAASTASSRTASGKSSTRS